MYGLVFWLFYKLVQNPLLIALVIAFALDAFVFGFRARFVRYLRGSRRLKKLEALLAINPHDRRARFELAELLVQRRRYARAVEVLKTNIEFGEHDAETLLLMGRACSGAGHFPQAVVFLTEASPLVASRGLGEAELALGEHWLRAKDAARAEESLLRFCKDRPGSIEGFLQLSWAQAALGKSNESRKSRRQAWLNYAEAPRFVRKRDRLWAFRVRPARTLVMGLAFLAAIIAVSLEVPAIFGRNPTAMGYAEEGPELRDVAIAGANQTQAWTPRALELRIAGAASRAEELNLRLHALRAGRGGPFFAEQGSDLILTCAGCGDPWVAGTLLRDARRLDVEILLQDGGSIRDAGVSRFLARQLEKKAAEDQVFELHVTVDGSPAELAAAEARVRTAFEAAGQDGLFPFGRVTVQTGVSKRLDVLIRMDPDNRTAAAALEVLRGPLCPGTCLPARIVEQSRVPPMTVLRTQKAHSDSTQLTKSLPGWFRVEDQVLARCLPVSEIKPLPQTLSHHPALARLLHGRALSWTIWPDDSRRSRAARVVLDPQGDLLAGAHFLAGEGPVFFERSSEAATLSEPSTKRTRTIKAEAPYWFMGFLRTSAVTVEPAERPWWKRISKTGAGSRVVLRGLDGVDFFFPGLSSSGGRFGSARLPGRRLALIEEDGAAARLAVHSLDSPEHQLQRIELPIRMPRDLSLAAAEDGSTLVLSVPAEDEQDKQTAILRVAIDRAEVAAGGFAPEWNELQGELNGAAWLTREEPGVLAVPLRPGAKSEVVRSPEGAELSWARPHEGGMIASAQDGFWLFEPGGTRRLLPEAVADFSTSAEGTLAAVIEGRIVLLGDGAREELAVPLHCFDLEWGQIASD